MSTQVLAPSATMLTVNTEHDKWMLALPATIASIAEIKAKGATREGFNLNQNKLVSSVLANYRMHFATLFGKGERLPSDIHEKIVLAVDEFMCEKMAMINVTNVVSVKRTFAYSDKKGVFEKVTAIGHNTLTLEYQRMGLIHFIAQAEKQLSTERAKINNDLVREGELQSKILKLSIAKTILEQEIAKLKEVTEVVK